MAVWLIARALGAPVPRRLAYVVDRRAVVDQASDVASNLRDFVKATPALKSALGLHRPLPISTLRGQWADNKEWQEDPASPAIIVGTVDMIGSRLLFEGYGVGRKMRPFQAGLLGVDTLAILDEAHLVPPFTKLLEAIADGEQYKPLSGKPRELIPPFRLLSMSATGARADTGPTFALGHNDLLHSVVSRRLTARKTLTFREIDESDALADVLAEEARKLSAEAKAPRIVVYCNSHQDAKRVAANIRKDGENKADVELLVGARRVFEREAVAGWLIEHGFAKKSPGTQAEKWVAPDRPSFLVATSAGEVGVDLDADHMVSDLVPWERMVQRFGRVNRFGNEKDAKLVVVHNPSPPKKGGDAAEADLARTKAAREVLRQFPENHQGRDVSSGSIRELRLRAEADERLRKLLESATTPAPLRPALTRPLVDAWSMTSLDEHTGRPEIQPWLRGWVDEDVQTRVVWRTFLPVRATEGGEFEASKGDVNKFFESAPPERREVLEAETWQVVKWLEERAKALRPKEKETYGIIDGSVTGPLGDHDVVAIVLTTAEELRTALRLPELRIKGRLDRLKDEVLGGATLVVDSRFAGLSEEGLLDQNEGKPPRTLDDGDPWGDFKSYRVRVVMGDNNDESDPVWVEETRIQVGTDVENEIDRWLVVEAGRKEEKREDARGVGRLQLLDEHGEWTEHRARNIAGRIGLPNEYTEALAVSARLHDEGKRAGNWQRAFHAPPGGIYAKTRATRIDFKTLDHYRHELGSLVEAETKERIQTLPQEIRDLALHLIASHHGFARPLITTQGVEGASPTALEGKQREISLRYARLQKEWGPWGLAWWESLLRAADHQASAENDARPEVS